MIYAPGRHDTEAEIISGHTSEYEEKRFLSPPPKNIIYRNDKSPFSAINRLTAYVVRSGASFLAANRNYLKM